ncbi:MAG TPA: MASE3 domain-containing protein, partial [Sedimentisphaerales bacterium]|nr:MASE3 domain-containing protein [Sedimentisphaerales bacterium]
MEPATGYALLKLMPRLELLAAVWYNHSLFYSITELFSIVISACVFLLMWNSRKYMRNNCLVFVGASCLFMAVINAVHLLSWNTPAILGQAMHGLSAEIWKVSRIIQSISFVIAPLLIGRRLNFRLLVAGYAAMAVLLVAAAIAGVAPEGWKNPEMTAQCTSFWFWGDLVTGILYLAAAILFYLKRSGFHPNVARYLLAAMLTLACSEWIMMLYPFFGLHVDFAGRAIQVVAFYLIYKAIVETGIVRPFHLMFLNLQKHQTMLEESLADSRRQKAETEALLQGAHHILRQPDFRQAADSIFSTCRKLIGASTGRFVIEYRGTSQIFEMDARGLLLDPVCRAHMSELAQWVRSSGKAMYRNHVEAEKLPARQNESAVHCRNILLAPLFDGNNTYGMFMLADKPAGFDENDAYLAAAFAELASIALSSSRARDELSESEGKLRTLISHVPGAVYRSTFTGSRAMEFISGMIEEISGYPPEDFINRSVRSFVSTIHPADVEMVQNCLNNAIAQRGHYDIEYRIIASSGRTKWVRDIGRYTEDVSGASFMLDGTIFDVTERRLADEQLQESRRLLELKVAERTAALLHANQQLEAQIAERRKLERQLLRSAEQEQQRIGQELHDGLGQELAGLAFMVGALARRLSGVRPQETKALNEIIELVHKAINEVRGVSKGLYPVEVRSGGLPSALRELAANTRKLFGVSCTFAADEGLDVRDAAVATHLYRIAQEAITNAIKHGRA